MEPRGVSRLRSLSRPEQSLERDPDRYAGLAAFYGLCLRNVHGMSARDAAALVLRRYPRMAQVSPGLVRVAYPVADPLADVKTGT